MSTVTHPSGKPSWQVPDPRPYLAAGWTLDEGPAEPPLPEGTVEVPARHAAAEPQ